MLLNLLKNLVFQRQSFRHAFLHPDRAVYRLGTELSGRASPVDRAARADVTVRRFPLGVHLPISAADFSGRVAVARYLTPTGSRVYEPASLALASPVQVTVESGQTVQLKAEATPKRLQSLLRRV